MFVYMELTGEYLLFNVHFWTLTSAKQEKGKKMEPHEEKKEEEGSHRDRK